MPDIPDLTAELDAAEAIVMGDDATCRYCGQLIVPCAEPIRYCKGWKHAAYLHYGPVGPHYCEGRSINPMAEPGGFPVTNSLQGAIPVLQGGEKSTPETPEP